jgi:formate-dependent nitrite reductase membrane component NrfD
MEVRTYYDRPVVKPPTWKHWIAEYMFLGGLAAGSSVLAFGASRTGRRRLARRAKLSATGAIATGMVALVADLGRPDRFHHMLRVAKPTSPMSVGSWLLAVYGPASGVAAMSDVLGVMPGIGTTAETVAALVAPAIATYTAVLASDTAVPAWHESREALPFVFAGGAAASAGALGMVLTPSGENGPAVRMTVIGAVGEIAAKQLLERRLGELAEPYHQGKAGMLSKAALACTGAGAVIGALRGGRKRGAAMLGGGLVVAGSLLERYAVLAAGKQSASDPKYVVKPQRERLGARQTGSSEA